MPVIQPHNLLEHLLEVKIDLLDETVEALCRALEYIEAGHPNEFEVVGSIRHCRARNRADGADGAGANLGQLGRQLGRRTGAAA